MTRDIPPRPESDAVRRLADTAAQLVLAIEDLARGQTRIRRTQNLIAAGVVVAVLCLAAGGFGAWRVWDCTDKNGKCYKRNAEQSAKVIAQLITGNERASECVVGAKDRAAYRACLRARR